MTKQPDRLGLTDFDFTAIDFTNGLKPLDFEMPVLKVDLASFETALDPDSFGFDQSSGNFLPPINARDGVLGETREKCGAFTRKGTPCRARALEGKRRCKFHGGASTGPKTPGGRERIAEAQRRRWAKWRAEQNDDRI